MLLVDPGILGLGILLSGFFLLLSVDLLFLALVLASKIFSSSSVYTLQHLQSQICQCLTSHGKGGLGLRYQKYFHWSLLMSLQMLHTQRHQNK